MRLYLDNCCFNRPFDDQSQPRIRLEAEAKLEVQTRILDGRLELAWSYILDYENAANPFAERRQAIHLWFGHATVDMDESPALLARAVALERAGVRGKDALHVACAIAGRCDYLLTTDDGLLRAAPRVPELRIVNPTTFVLECCA
jgi:predicted nucleic acid-binding protein